ncbi:Histidine kinase [Chitinophaga sp. YR627]|uniref:sensor histidine kinase n=1 Tax=Chitinophaga sp. YR627 TaxID=1881041 RepID=UPI0008E72252|nr:histidine kinase [Chitinophaga sp. YR627]SFO21918.1 Histidine kinase [Chitinophaga sp. YR627]
MYISRNIRTFRVSNAVIWTSALFIGILASVPKILRIHITKWELLADISVATSFSILIWYFNIYMLPTFRAGAATARFASKRLAGSLALGIVVMAALVAIYQLILPQYHFQSMMLMYEFRGLVINLTIYLFLHLIYQHHITQLISVELEKTKADNLSAQFELLKQQVNPHFLFNSLNTLKSMVEMQDQHASRFIVMLSDFYRSSLETRKQHLISMQEELSTLDAYLFLLKARFEDGISLTVKISDAHRASCIPPFTLQLLIENCIKHNIVSLGQPLHIHIFSEDAFIVVENNLQMKRTPEPSTGVGLTNIAQRYQSLHQQQMEIIKDSTSFKVKLPVLHEDTRDRR